MSRAISMLESYSNHLQFYEQRATRKEDFLVSLFLVIPELMLFFILLIPDSDGSHSNDILGYFYQNSLILPILCVTINLLLMFVFTRKRVITAKQALSGSLIDIKPRYVSSGGIGILAKVHPRDTEIGKPIYESFNDDLKSGDILFLNGARVTEVKKEKYTWTETIRPYSSYDEGERYGYGSGGGGASQVVSGTSVRIHTTLVHDGVTYSGNRFNSKKEDIVDVIVKIWSTDESKISVNLIKNLSSIPNDTEDE